MDPSVYPAVVATYLGRLAFLSWFSNQIRKTLKQAVLHLKIDLPCVTLIWQASQTFEMCV